MTGNSLLRSLPLVMCCVCACVCVCVRVLSSLCWGQKVTRLRGRRIGHAAARVYVCVWSLWEQKSISGCVELCAESRVSGKAGRLVSLCWARGGRGQGGSQGQPSFREHLSPSFFLLFVSLSPHSLSQVCVHVGPLLRESPCPPSSFSPPSPRDPSLDI